MMEGGLLVNGRPCQWQCRKQLTQEYPLHEPCHSFGPSRHRAAKKHPWYADNSLRWPDLPPWTHSSCILSPRGPWYHLRALSRLNPGLAIKHSPALCGSVNLSMSSQMGSPGARRTEQLTALQQKAVHGWGNLMYLRWFALRLESSQVHR